MTREEPRRRDWWLVGCASLAAVLIVVDASAVLSDEAVAGPAAETSLHSSTLSAFGEPHPATTASDLRLAEHHRAGRSLGIV